MATIKDVVKVDDHTVDFITTTPNPILTAEWATCFIMDKEWSEKHGSENPTSVTEGKKIIPHEMQMELAPSWLSQGKQT